MFSKSLGHFHTDTTQQRKCSVMNSLIGCAMHRDSIHFWLNGTVPLVRNTMCSIQVVPIR